MEQIQEIRVVILFAEVCLYKIVNGRFEHEGVVNRDHAHLGNTIPAGLATTSDGRVHHVIGDKEEGLQLDTNPDGG